MAGLLAQIGIPGATSAIGSSSNLAGGSYNLTPATTQATPVNHAYSALAGVPAPAAPPALSFPSTPNGVRATTPTTTTPSTTIPSSYAAPPATQTSSGPTASQIQGLAASNPTALSLLPGETPQAYNSRIATLLAGQGGGQTGSNGGGNLATLPQAPQGYQANATFNPMNPSGSITLPPQGQDGTAPTGNYTGYTPSGTTTYGTGSPNATVTPTQNAAPSYPGLIQQLTGGAQGALNQGAGNYQNAQDNAAQTYQQLQTLENQVAMENGTIGSNPGILSNTFGRQQALQQQYGGQEQALATALQAEQGLASTGVSAQGQGLSALGTATGAAAPGNQNVQVPYSNQYLNGSTGQPINPQDATAMQSAVALEARKVQNNQETYAQAQTNLANYSQAGLNALNQALGPNFNANTNAGSSAGQQAVAGAGGSAQASNIETAGTTATSTAAQGYQQSVQAYQSANTAYSQAQGQATNLQSAMTGINGINSQYANTAINKLQSQFGSAKYSTFITSLNEAQQAYTNLLSSVGAATPTVNGQQATDIFNPSSTPAQINAAIAALNNAAYAKLQPLYSQAATYQSNLNAGTGGGTGASTTNTSPYEGW